MYWPLGTPTVYAASSQSTQQGAIQTSDGVSPGDTTSAVHKNALTSSADRQHSEDASDPAITTDEESEYEDDSTPRDRLLTQSAEKDASLRSHSVKVRPRRDTHSVDVVDEIIAVRVARAGHIIVTLTKTSLSVWQTRVGQNQSLTVSVRL